MQRSASRSSLVLAVLFGAACTPVAGGVSPAPAPTAPPKVVELPAVPKSLAAVGLDTTALDRTANPCTDFYQFACGGWLARTPIPADKPRWSRGFATIQERNELELRKILEVAALSKASEPLTYKLGAYYAACMDEAALEKAGTAAIQPLLTKIARVKDVKSLGAVLTELHRHRIWALFDIAADQDFKDATKVIASLDQNGLGLPDRDYYLRTDEKSVALRKTYQAHVATMLALGGAKKAAAEKAALEIVKLETELAKVSKTRVERRDPHGIYNKIDRAGVEKTVPAFPWAAYFDGLGRPELKEINVTSVKFFEGLSALLGRVSFDTWRQYLRWHVLHALASSLPKRFEEEDFKLEQAITGQKEQRKRWKRCVEATDRALGELLAQPYVKARFAGESKRAAEEMVKHVAAAFSEQVARLDWMDATTKARAMQKLKAMAYLIGYPSKWRSYDFEVKPGAFAANRLAARAFELAYDLGKIGKPVDRELWEMTPPTVNAYYHPNKNQMVFPAGILQPPFYSVSAAVAVNLGGMGMVVGHELTHGFDDQGAKFDAAGNLKNWWSSSVEPRFNEKTQCVADQYAGYEALPGLKLNGKLTLGENVADLGGIKLAFRAYRRMRAGAKERVVAEGFSEDQQFFLSVGQTWCAKYREEYARLVAQVDPHSPPKWRVNGPLSNLPEFAQAFKCAAGTTMRPQKTCAVW